MTDKEKIRKEVERLQKELVKEKEKGLCSDVDDACILELQNVLIYIDSLQEESVSNDLEETLKDYAYQVAYDLSNDWLEDNATWEDVETAVKLGAQWQKQQMLDKACEWLRQHMKTLPELSNKDLTKYTLWKRDEIIDKFRKAMEE